MAKDRFRAKGQRERMRDHGYEHARSGPGQVPWQAANALRTLGYRVKKTDRPDVDAHTAEIAGFALERTVKALAGEITDDKEATATLKAAAMVREEMCEPVEKVTAVKGTLTLEQLVAAANAPAPKAE